MRNAWVRLRGDKLFNLVGEENNPDFIVVRDSREGKNGRYFGNHILLEYIDTKIV